MELKSEFIGTKRVLATEMNRLEYTNYRGWTLPGDENGEAPGYLVEYLDGGKPNHPNHEGFISWLPRTQFDNAYAGANSGMSFGGALIYLQQTERRVTRRGWNGASMWLTLVPARGWDISRSGSGDADGGYEQQPFLMMKTAQGMLTPWAPSQSDVLASDWFILP